MADGNSNNAGIATGAVNFTAPLHYGNGRPYGRSQSRTRRRSQSGPRVNYKDKYERLLAQLERHTHLWNGTGFTSFAVKSANAKPVFVNQVEVGWLVLKGKGLPGGADCVCLTPSEKPAAAPKKGKAKSKSTDSSAPATKADQGQKSPRGLSNLILVNNQADVSGKPQILVIEPSRENSKKNGDDYFGLEARNTPAGLPHTLKQALESDAKFDAWQRTLQSAIKFAEEMHEYKQAGTNPWSKGKGTGKNSGGDSNGGGSSKAFTNIPEMGPGSKFPGEVDT